MRFSSGTKNRDLFDLNEGLVQLSLNAEKVVATFGHYLKHEGNQITRANAEERMLAKLTRSLTDDIAPLWLRALFMATLKRRRHSNACGSD